MPILLIEDDMADANLIKHAFKKTEVSNPIIHFENAIAAWYYITEKENHEADNESKIALILLDLNMPGIDGRELLDLLKGTKIGQATRTVVLTGAACPTDMADCYNKGVDSFIEKPSNYTGLCELTENLSRYWKKDLGSTEKRE